MQYKTFFVTVVTHKLHEKNQVKGSYLSIRFKVDTKYLQKTGKVETGGQDIFANCE